MLPIGGELVWGNFSSAPDDIVTLSPSDMIVNDISQPRFDSLIKTHIEKHGSNGNFVYFSDSHQENITAGLVENMLFSIDAVSEAILT